MSAESFEIFLTCAPGLEPVLAEEARELEFQAVRAQPGGVAIHGSWPEVWRANLCVRGASRVLARIDGFGAPHLARLDKRARRTPWASILRPDIAVSVEASCRGSRIYHSSAAVQRIETAIRETLGVRIDPDAPVRVQARIHKDFCTLSVDTSGELLHRRGFKQAVAKAPMRETLAALLLRASGYTGTECVLDPMCGSGTFVMEAADMALGLAPGRARSFAFEHLKTFDPAQFEALKASCEPKPTRLQFYGSDRDGGAVRSARENAERAGLSDHATFQECAVADLVAPKCDPGLVIVNPPYGDRIANRGALVGVHRTLGLVLRERFSRWRVALVTSEPDLAMKTGLPFEAPGPWIEHGGLKVRLFQTGPLG